MANRKKHLKYQARRSGTGEVLVPSKENNEPSKALKPKTPELVKSTPKTSQQKPSPQPFTQMSDAETQLVWSELRHGVFTVIVILFLFLAIGLIFHFTSIDENIYSLFSASN